ncbi:MAG: hypothetical protein JST54_21730 [Deltaproteobacteria bacterium]|nr:hypothetical protein [Deltaproteobacteria bacterium]
MGTWGADIFDGDLASDLRGQLRDLLGEGVPPARAIKQLLAEWNDALRDPEDGPIVILALAATGWDLGRPDAALFQRALKLIDAGADLAHWEQEAPKLAPARRRALNALAAKLRKPPPKPKRIPKRVLAETDLEVGDLVGYRLSTGAWVALVVNEITQDKGGRYPIVDVVDWIGREPPTEKDVRGKPAKGAWFKSVPHFREERIFVYGLKSSAPSGPVRVVAKRFPRPSVKKLGPPIALGMFQRVSELESTLTRTFRLKPARAGTRTRARRTGHARPARR